MERLKSMIIRAKCVEDKNNKLLFKAWPCVIGGAAEPETRCLTPGQGSWHQEIKLESKQTDTGKNRNEKQAKAGRAGGGVQDASLRSGSTWAMTSGALPHGLLMGVEEKMGLKMPRATVLIILR